MTVATGGFVIYFDAIAVSVSLFVADWLEHEPVMCQDSGAWAASRNPPRNLALPLQLSRPVMEHMMLVLNMYRMAKFDYCTVIL